MTIRYDFAGARAYLADYYTAPPRWLERAAVLADLGKAPILEAFRSEAARLEPAHNQIREAVLDLALELAQEADVAGDADMADLCRRAPEDEDALAEVVEALLDGMG